MKKNNLFLSTLSLLLIVLCLASCGEKNTEDKEETTREPDWRNSIEYEGHFYVSEKIKILYSLDQGKVTLWDNSGNGSIMQTLEFDSTESDVLERFEFKDFNHDGYTDIRTVYKVSGSSTYYNLWLWYDLQSTFVFSNLYQEIPNPVQDDSGHISSEQDLGIFGLVKREYKFNEKLTCELLNVETTDMDAIADTIMKAVTNCNSLAEVSTTTISGNKCVVYLLSENGVEKAYLSATEDSTWYLDLGETGAYRILFDDDGSIAVGTYVDEAYYAESMVLAKYGLDSVNITSTSKGTIGDFKCKLYTFDNNSYAAVSDSYQVWWSEDGEKYYKANYSTGYIDLENEFTAS